LKAKIPAPTVKDPTPNAHLVNGLNREIFCDVVEYNLLPPVRIPFCNLARAPSLADDETLARVELATLRTIFSSSLLFIVKVQANTKKVLSGLFSVQAGLLRLEGKTIPPAQPRA
jgi:hypothetical protein